MNTDLIINKAHKEASQWRGKGYRKGKFIIGVDVRNTLFADAKYAIDGTIDKNRLLGYQYVIDYENPEDIDFCPID